MNNRKKNPLHINVSALDASDIPGLYSNRIGSSVFESGHYTNNQREMQQVGRDAAEFMLAVPSSSTAHIEEMHLLIIHTWCQIIDKLTAPQKSASLFSEQL